MGIVSDGLDRAIQRAFTRPIPKSAGAQMRYLVKQLKGTRPVAELLGVSQRTVERYVRDQIRRPRPDLAGRLADAVRARWQPRIREHARRQAATSTVTSCSSYAPNAVRDFPTRRSVPRAGDVRSRSHVHHWCSRKNAVMTCCTHSRANSTARPGTAYSTPDAKG